ncbi:hypothetical protein DFH27DRAFT_73240 [Peziza echinospora]|nr:hypothetical protein DFH27DRAFT_73240 [Peziza echinospora]
MQFTGLGILAFSKRNLLGASLMLHSPLFALFLVVLLFVPPSVANVEKTIFNVPAEAAVGLALDPSGFALLPSLQLTPTAPRLAIALNTSFTGPTKLTGSESWTVVHGLKIGASYEVRICWAATSPTEFTLRTYTPSEIAASPMLISGMSDFRLPETQASLNGPLLYLQISSKADYYTLDRRLMTLPEPVHVELVLDSLILHVLPQSLLKIVGVVTVVALSSWWASSGVYTWLLSTAIDNQKKRR